jgi:hypothetical protein
VDFTDSQSGPEFDPEVEGFLAQHTTRSPSSTVSPSEELADFLRRLVRHPVVTQRYERALLDSGAHPSAVRMACVLPFGEDDTRNQTIHVVAQLLGREALKNGFDPGDDLAPLVQQHAGSGARTSGSIEDRAARASTERAVGWRAFSVEGLAMPLPALVLAFRNASLHHAQAASQIAVRVAGRPNEPAIPPSVIRGLQGRDYVFRAGGNPDAAPVTLHVTDGGGFSHVVQEVGNARAVFDDDYRFDTALALDGTTLGGMMSVAVLVDAGLSPDQADVLARGGRGPSGFHEVVQGAMMQIAAGEREVRLSGNGLAQWLSDCNGSFDRFVASGAQTQPLPPVTLEDLRIDRSGPDLFGS